MHITTEDANKIVEQAIDKGFEHYRKGETDMAEMLYKQILCVNENHVVALQMLGLIESRKPGMVEEAIKKLKKAESLDPTNADVHNNIGLVYSWSDIKDNNIAEYHYRKAIEYNPAAMHFYSNLGIHLKSMNKVKEAEEVFLQALSIDDKASAIHFNYGTLLGEIKQWDKATFHYEKAIELDPECAPAHYNLATVYLNNGDFARGWKEYEWRWDTYPQFKRIYDRFPMEKMWTGTQDVTNKRFFIYAEQGMGDTIQFSRFIQCLKDKGASRIVVEEHSDLVSLMKTLPSADKIVTYGDPVEEFDYHCSMVSLPYYLQINDFKDIPNKPYLKCNYADLPDMPVLEDKHWQVYTGFRVGIVWAGNPVHRHDPWRSSQLKYFRILEHVPGVKLFSLQKDTRVRYYPGVGEKDLTEGSDGMNVVDLKDYMIDYNATAALIDRMDLVIGVDTATLHLAAAMGKPAWLLVAYHNDWRWLKTGNTTHWYPSMKIFRQPTQGDWDSVFKQLEQELLLLV